MEQTLKISITADNKQALAGLRETVTSMQGVSVAAGKAGTAVAKTGKDFTGMSRVIQDLPYGFNGIANNLTQLIPAAGAAGLAFSALVTALTFASVGFGAWTRSAGGAKKAADDLATSIASLNDVELEANKTAGEQITNAKYLFDAVTDLNIPYKERLKYAKELKAEYPTILSNIKAEDIATGKVKITLDQFTQSILANARAKAASAKISELETKKLDALYNIEKIRAVGQANMAKAKGYDTGGEASTFVDAERERVMIAADMNKKLKEQETIVSSLEAQQSSLERAAGKSNIAKSLLGGDGGKDPVEKLTDIQRALKTLDQELLKAQGRFEAGLISEGAFNADSVNAYDKAMGVLLENKVKPLSDEFQKLIEKQKQFFGTGEVGNLGKAFETVGTEKTDLTQSATQPNGDQNQKRIDELTRIAHVTQANKDAQKAWNEQLAYANQLANIGASAFEGLFNSLANGKDFGTAVIDMFASLAAEIARAVAKALILKVVLAALGIATGGVAGVVVGAVVGEGMNAAQRTGGADGGVFSGPKSGYPVMMHGLESIVNPSQMKKIIGQAAMMGAEGGGGGRGITRVMGNDLWIINQRTNQMRTLTTGR